MTRPITISLLLVSFLAGGCTYDHKERVVANYFGGNDKVQLDEAPFAGDYVLYQLPKKGNYVPVQRTHIEPPDKVGFQRAEDGSLDAIAGKTNYPLEPGYYTWRGTPDAGQLDAKHTGVQIGTGVLVVVGVGIVIAGVALAL